MNLPRVDIGDPFKVGRITRLRSEAGIRAHYARIADRLRSGGQPLTMLALPAPATPHSELDPLPPMKIGPPVPDIAASFETKVEAVILRARWRRSIRQHSLKATISAASECFGVSLEELHGPSRKRRISLPRQIAMAVANNAFGQRRRSAARLDAIIQP